MYSYSYEGDLDDEHFILMSRPVNDAAANFVTSMEGAHWMLDDALPRIVRANVLPIFLLLGIFTTFYVFYKVFGDVFFKTLGFLVEKVFSSFTYELPEMKAAQPDYTAIYEAELTPEQEAYFKKNGKLPAEDAKEGFVVNEERNTVLCVWQEGDFRLVDNDECKAGDFKRTWQVCRDAGIHNYDILINPQYKHACEYLTEKNMMLVDEKKEFIYSDPIKEELEEEVGAKEKEEETTNPLLPALVPVVVEEPVVVVEEPVVVVEEPAVVVEEPVVIVEKPVVVAELSAVVPLAPVQVEAKEEDKKEEPSKAPKAAAEAAEEAPKAEEPKTGEAPAAAEEEKKKAE